MWTKIIVLALVSVVLAKNIEYTKEDAHRDILAIITHAFGLKTNSDVRERKEESEENRRNDMRMETNQPGSNALKSKHSDIIRQNSTLKYNTNQRLGTPVKATSRSSQRNGSETYYEQTETNKKRAQSTTEARRRDGDTNKSQGQPSFHNYHKTNNGERTNKTNEISNLYTKDGTAKTALNDVKPTPSLEDVKETGKESDEKSRDATKHKTGPKSRDDKANATQVSSQGETTEKIDATRKTSTEDQSSKNIEGDIWVWETTQEVKTTTPAVGDRAAFEGDKCPTGKVKFGNTCVDED